MKLVTMDNLSLTQQYLLADKIRSKLYNCVNNTKAQHRNKEYNLRVLVGHAMLLDKLMDNLNTTLTTNASSCTTVTFAEEENAKKVEVQEEYHNNNDDDDFFYSYSSSDEDEEDEDDYAGTDDDDDDDDVDEVYTVHNYSNIDNNATDRNEPEFQYRLHKVASNNGCGISNVNSGIKISHHTEEDEEDSDDERDNIIVHHISIENENNVRNIGNVTRINTHDAIKRSITHDNSRNEVDLGTLNVICV
ncbi:Ecm13p SCDLUD_000080 [Saccharomycodes ludwigii]|uniref:Ecm13p n=1 Tax=Saccharomycodes ludwigii TaxID=36035 RepID=UPI001E841AF7|nr:hypothetical protein SCDLUD_000080 [Saccharomycodes ludwigii]KAH3902503.1 hypothetical protein SCDLUD_000080 [Saccharomycodes ludwigii]